MSLKVKVGPPHLTVHQGHTVLVTETDGQIKSPSSKGLYFFDTRLISGWMIYADGEPWDVLNSGTPTSFTTRIFLANRGLLTEWGSIAPHTVGLTLDRHIDSGMHEDLDLTNHASATARFNLEIVLRSDFADIFEVKSETIVRRGRIVTSWSADNQRLTTTYRNRDFNRSLTVTASKSGSRAVYANGRISFAIELSPGASWHGCLEYDLYDGETCFAAPIKCGWTKDDRPLVDRQYGALKLETSNDDFKCLFRQAADDLAALRLPVVRGDRTLVVPTAGLPWFVALFDRVDPKSPCLSRVCARDTRGPRLASGDRA